MRPLLRLASFGGWLAHVLNQNVLWNYDFSNSVRPGFVLIYVFTFGFGPVAMSIWQVQYLLGYSSTPALPRGEEGFLVFLVAAGSLALLLAVGWLVRFVPFVRDRDQSPRPAAPMALGSAVPAHATGIFGVKTELRRFRHRPAMIERRTDGELHVLVKRHWMVGSDVKGPWATSASARLLPSNVRRIRRGTAHLVSDARPAIEVGWLHGPILLDFDDAETRDRVFAQLRQLHVAKASA